MDDTTIFYIGVFVMVLFFAGIFFTIFEFRSMYSRSEDQQRRSGDSVHLNKSN